MEFSELIQKLFDCIAKEDPAGFVRSVFIAATGYPEDEFTPDNQLYMTEDGYRKLFYGKSGISRKAKYLLPAFKGEAFRKFIIDRCNELGRYEKLDYTFNPDGMREDLANLSFDITALFVETLQNATTSRKKKSDNKKKSIAERLDDGERVFVDLSKITFDPKTKRVDKCPRCGRTEFSPEAQACPDCGTKLINYCTSEPVIYASGMPDDVPHACLPTERFCPICSAPTIYFQKYKLMKPVEEENGYEIRDGEYVKTITEDDCPF